MAEPLPLDERIEILNRIAREGSDTAAIQAIKELRSFDGDEDSEDEDGFAGLDEVTARRHRRQAS